MKRDKILELFKMLAQSQGYYGRLLRDIDQMDFETRERFWPHLEDQNFQQDVDVVLYLEM